MSTQPDSENRNVKTSKSGNEFMKKSKPTLSERIYYTLYNRINNGDYADDPRLPSEYELAESFGVSRPVLRSALEKLRQEGVIVSRQGAGNFVQVQSISQLGFARVETLADVQRCYEFRLTIETAAAEQAAERRNEAALKSISEALEMMQTATGHNDHNEEADFNFHLSIAKASNNHYFESSMRALRDHINVGMKMHGQSLMTDGSKALTFVFKEHHEIYQAIKDQDGKRAAHWMREHLEHSRERLFGYGLLDLRMRESDD